MVLWKTWVTDGRVILANPVPASTLWCIHQVFSFSPEDGKLPSLTHRLWAQSSVSPPPLVTQHFFDGFCVWFCVSSCRLREAAHQRSFPVDGRAAVLSGVRSEEKAVLLLSVWKGGLSSRKPTFRTERQFSSSISSSVSCQEMNTQQRLKQPLSLVWAAPGFP